MKDDQIVNSIKAGKHNKALKQLYREFPKVKAFILKNNGKKEQAQEIFNDSLLLLVEKVQDEQFVLQSSLSSFLYGIARFLWMNELKKMKKTQAVEWEDALQLSAEDINYDEEKEKKLNAVEKILDTISEKCKQILEMFYYEKHSMQTIASKLRFSSVNSAKTQKYKCLERATKLASNIY